MDHPYRTATPSKPDASASPSPRFEGRALGSVLALCGGGAMAAGFSAPATHPMELVLGAALVILGALTFWRA